MRIKNLLLLFFLLLSYSFSYAGDGYRIQLHLKNTQDSIVYLVHYYGKPLPTIYISDSAKIDKKGNALFHKKDSVLGGIYMILFSDRQTHFEFLLNNGDNMTIEADVKSLPESIKFKNSPENDHFLAYMNFLTDFSKRQKTLQEELSKAQTAEDTNAIRQKGAKLGKELTQYRRDYAQKHPQALLSQIFNAMETPEVPEGKHYFPDGTEDTMFAYTYYKAHYWDKFNFKDDRLIHTPIYENKLDEYINKLTFPHEDSVIKESDMLLTKTKGQIDLFKYTLYWLTRNAETSKVMGMDKVFVYLVENYYMRGAAFWLDNDALQKYYEAAAKKSNNLIGKVAPEIVMQDINGKVHRLSEFKAKYTLLVFWDPTCGHCTKEIPRIDSVYRAVLKDKGVRVMAIRTESPVEKWTDFIEKNNLHDWLHLYDPEHKSDYRFKYDVFSTPVIYLLDEKKIIRGKRLDHSNIMQVIELTEKNLK